MRVHIQIGHKDTFKGWKLIICRGKKVELFPINERTAKQLIKSGIPFEG